MESQKFTTNHKLARSPNGTPPGGLLSSDKRVKKILEWIEAYSRLVDKDIEYFEKSINADDKKLKRQYRKISDQYNIGVMNLVKKLP